MDNIITSTVLNIWSVIFRIVLSVILGGFIGLERGHHGRAAGLRTHILVCLGATMTTMIGLYSTSILGYNSDPLRVGAQVISGIGFLGVGTILVKNRAHVTGLTTAAGLWTTACIGLSIGIGFYWAAILAFLAVIISVSILAHLEPLIKSKDCTTCYIEFLDVGAVKMFCEEIKQDVTSIDIIPAKSGISTHIGLELRAKDIQTFESICQKANNDQSIVIALPSKFQK